MAKRSPTTDPEKTDPYPPGWEPFLAAINEDLDDDGRRLVFSDWLEEHGDPARAEFIRLQCATARGKADTGAADALLQKHRPRWLFGLPKGLQKRPDWCVFRRGLIAELTVLGKYWMSTGLAEIPDASGRAIRRITALEELRFQQEWNTVVESSTLAGIRSLSLSGAGSGLIGSLAKSPALPTLTDLTIVAKSSNGLAQWAFRDLFASKSLTRLRRLCFKKMVRGDLLALGLADAAFDSLEELHLRSAALDASGAESLAHAPALANLRVLDLYHNQIGDDGLAYLLAAPRLRNLEEFVLAECKLTSASVSALAKWEGLRSVRLLDLRDNGLNKADAKKIVRSPHARNLSDVRLVLVGLSNPT